MIECTLPWTSLMLAWGDFYVCCVPPHVALGKIEDYKDLDDIWNGEPIQYLRRMVLAGRIREICNPECPFLGVGAEQNQWTEERRIIDHICSIGDTEQRERAWDNYTLAKEEMYQGKTILKAKPAWFNISPDSTCNLRCIHCYNWRLHYSMPDTYKKLLEDTHSTLAFINVTGGEPFVAPKSKELFDHLIQKEYKFLVAANTHGLNLDFALLARLPLGQIGVSVDGVTKETYEKIRRGASWERLLTNLDQLLLTKELQKRSLRPVILWTVMTSNYKEIVTAIAFFEGKGLEIRFTPAFLRKDDPENILERSELHADFLSILEEAITKTEGLLAQTTLRGMIDLTKKRAAEGRIRELEAEAAQARIRELEERTVWARIRHCIKEAVQFSRRQLKRMRHISVSRS